MQCPRCDATAPDTMSRCGRCDSPLQAAPAGHEPAAASSYDGPPPIQHTPLGAPIYEGGGGPPVQAFVESAEESWRPLAQQPYAPSTPSTPQAPVPPPPAPQQTAASAPASPQSYPAQSYPAQSYPAQPYPAQPYPAQPSAAPSAQGLPAGEISEPPGEATQMWTPPPALSDLPAGAAPPDAQGPPTDSVHVPPRHATADWNTPQPPMAQPPMAQPPMPAPGLPQHSVPPDESVTERTMAVWFSDPASANPATGPDPGSQTPVYGTSVPQGGQGRNETAILGDLPPVQQPGGWSPEAWHQPGQGGFGPGGEPGAAPPHRPASGPSKPLIITVAGLVAVALVAAVMVLWPDGGGDNKTAASSGPSQAAAQTPATSTTTSSVAHREAVLVNRVLNASATSRGELARALAAAGTCRGLPTAISGFQRVATQRRSQIARTRALKVGRLPNGVRLRQTLARSIQYSLAVDQALLTWAQGRQGCHGKPKPDANFRQAGGPLSAQASAAKSQFATLWTPVAKQQRLPARTANSF
jgi:hypothetical protein